MGSTTFWVSGQCGRASFREARTGASNGKAGLEARLPQSKTLIGGESYAMHLQASRQAATEALAEVQAALATKQAGFADRLALLGRVAEVGERGNTSGV